MSLNKLINAYKERRTAKARAYELLADANDSFFSEFPDDSILAQKGYEEAVDLIRHYKIFSFRILRQKRLYERTLQRVRESI